MNPITNLLLSVSPQTQSARKLRNFASLALQRRSLYGRERRCNAGKELDAETGLYYYGARYLDPKTSRWLSGDPAMGEYVPQAGADNSKLPNGGMYNSVNFHAYHYANNNPVKYIDPNGRTADEIRDLTFRPWSDANNPRDLLNRPHIDCKYGVSKLSFDNGIFIGFTIPVDERFKNTLRKIWALPLTIVGIAIGSTLHLIGTLMGTGSYVKIENNAITFTTGLKIGGSITLGNTIIHANGPVKGWNSKTITKRYDGTGNVMLGRHEEAHTHQYEKYGIFTPFLIIGSAILNGGIRAGLKGGGFHDFMGRSLFEIEADDYSKVY